MSKSGSGVRQHARRLDHGAVVSDGVNVAALFNRRVDTTNAIIDPEAIRLALVQALNSCIEHRSTTVRFFPFGILRAITIGAP